MENDKNHDPDEKYKLIKKRYLTKIGIKIDFKHSEVFKESDPINIPKKEGDNEIDSFVPIFEYDQYYKWKHKKEPYLIYNQNRNIN